MDADTDLNKYFEALKGQKDLLQRSKARKGERPSDRRDSQMIYLHHMMSVVSMGTVIPKDQHTFRSSWVPEAYPPCVKPLAELRPIFIKYLQLETQHRGTYLMVRCTTPPARMTAVITVLEDENGDMETINMYHREREHERKADDCFGLGRVLIIKEPYYKITGGGTYGLRVDHLSDIVLLEDTDSRVPERWQRRVIEEKSAEELKLLGNQTIAQADYHSAIAQYSLALARSPTAELEQILKRNRALAYLRIGYLDAALTDTGFPDFGNQPADKALVRALEALYYKKMYKKCIDVAEAHTELIMNNAQGPGFLARAKARMLEYSTGNFDFKRLQAEANTFVPPFLDHADYTSAVQVKDTASHGLGLFTLKDVKAGDLLLVEQGTAAFVEDLKPAEKKGTSDISLMFNVQTDRGFIGTQANLWTILIQKARRNASFAKRLTSLYHGNYEASDLKSVDGEPILDSFLIERVMTYNVFGCPKSSLKSHNELTKLKKNVKSRPDDKHHSSGIWLTASRINHSCFGNARRSFIGDFMIIRAACDMDAGTEIRFPYAVHSGKSQADVDKKLSHWNFKCGCVICTSSRSEGAAIVRKRDRIKEDLEQSLMPVNGSPNVGKSKKLLDQLNETYRLPPTEVPRLLVWDPYVALSRYHAVNEHHFEVLVSVQRCLVALGFITVGCEISSELFKVVKWGVVEDHVVEVFCLARDAFDVLGAKDDGDEAHKLAKTAYRIVVGEDDTFDLMKRYTRKQ